MKLNTNEEKFQEFNLFDMTTNRMEYEANLFAAQIGLDENQLWEYIIQGWDDISIARALNSDVNLVALKVSAMSRNGCKLRIPFILCHITTPRQ